MKKILDAFLIGFLPKIFQETYGEKNNLKMFYFNFLSSFFTIIISIIFWASFLGFYLKFKPGKFWIILITIFFSILIIDSIVRFVLMIFKKKKGFFVFSLFYKYLLKLKENKDFNDDILEIDKVLIIHSPCPKPHWLKWGGLSYNERNYKISKHLRLEITHFFKLERSDERFPEYDKEKEKNFNISSDLSIILSPLWGFLPEKYQYSLLRYERYNLKFNFYLSIILTFFVSFPSIIFDLIRVMQRQDVLYFILPHFLVFLYFLYESIIRFWSFVSEKKIKGSLLSFIIKPLYYMIYGEFL